MHQLLFSRSKDSSSSSTACRERETSVREPTQGLPVSTQGYAQSPGPSPSSIQTVPYLFKKHSWWASTGSGTVLDSRDIRMPRKGTSDLFGV